MGEIVRDRVHLALGVGNLMLTVVALVFWLGVDHQRIVTVESGQRDLRQQMLELNREGTMGTRARLDNLEHQMDRQEQLLVQLLKAVK